MRIAKLFYSELEGEKEGGGGGEEGKKKFEGGLKAEEKKAVEKDMGAIESEFQKLFTMMEGW